MSKKKVAFICVHNSCRSQMAEGFGRYFGEDVMESYSAGSEEYPEVKPLAVEVMKEAGIDVSNQYPKLIKDIPQDLDYVITMGCGVQCPIIKGAHKEDWGLDDPSGKSIDEFRKTRDQIEIKVKELVERIKNSAE
ncbi:MAG: arsenate reductase ArsC [Eubacteriales bacterium]